MSFENDERLIAGMLADRQVYERSIALGLQPEHFVKPHLFASFVAMYQLAHKGEKIDRLNVLSRLPEKFRFDADPCLVPIDFTLNLEAVVDAVKTEGIVNRARQKAQDLHRLLLDYENGKGVGDITRLSVELSELLTAKTTAEASSFSQVGESYMDLLEERIASFRCGKTVGIPTGISTLDDVIYGWNPGALYTLAARAGMGKTTFACNVCLEAAQRGYATVFYTVEMGADEIFEKALSRLSQVNIDKVILGDLNADQSAKVELAFAQNKDLPIHIRSLRAPRLESLTNDIRAFKRREGIKLCIIDYVQLLKTMSTKRARHEEISEITGTLKELARELQIPIILLAQLNRKAEEFGEPDKTHLKDSGSIEQDSDVVMLIFADQDGQVWLKIDKNRKGKPGRIRLKADLARNYFGEDRGQSKEHWSDR